MALPMSNQEQGQVDTQHGDTSSLAGGGGGRAMGTAEPPFKVPSEELPEATEKATAQAELAEAEALAADPVARALLPCLTKLMAVVACMSEPHEAMGRNADQHMRCNAADDAGKSEVPWSYCPAWAGGAGQMLQAQDRQLACTYAC